MSAGLAAFGCEHPGLTPGAKIVSPLRGWNRIIPISTTSGGLTFGFSRIRNAELRCSSREAVKQFSHGRKPVDWLEQRLSPGGAAQFLVSPLRGLRRLDTKP